MFVKSFCTFGILSLWKNTNLCYQRNLIQIKNCKSVIVLTSWSSKIWVNRRYEFWFSQAVDVQFKSAVHHEWYYFCSMKTNATTIHEWNVRIFEILSKFKLNYEVISTTTSFIMIVHEKLNENRFRYQKPNFEINIIDFQWKMI